MTLVYQAYGREDIIRQSLFSILTFLRWGSKEKILVYTDKANLVRTFFQAFSSVEVVEVAQEDLKKWRGQIDFVHRVKIEILLEASRRTKSSLLYLDGDTVFLKNPQDMISLVGPGQHLMHVMESKLNQAKDPLTKKMAKFCAREQFKLHRGIVAIPLATEMWNAGVIGLHESRINLLEKILELTDVAYSLYQKHVVEQLAVSYFLQSAGKVQAAEPWILHYWQSKEIWQARIDAFLNQHKDAADALVALEKFDFSLPIIAAKKSFWQRIFS